MPNTKLSRAVEMMIKTAKMHRGMMETKAKELGIHRTQHRILMNLAREGNLPSQKELADRLDITPAAVTIALRKIESDGYVKRTLGHDSRYNELEITQKGRALVKRTHELFGAVDIAMFEGFSDKEFDAYISCLEKIQKNIKSKQHRKENQQ